MSTKTTTGAPHTSTVTAKDGIQWHCERQGQGPHFILIPSGEGDCAAFAKVAALLSPSFTVTTFDMPGMSRTTAPDSAMKNLTAGIIAQQVVNLLDELAIDITTVYGCSSGGLVALALAADHPSRVRSVIVHEVPLGHRPWPLKGMDDATIVQTCRHIFSKVMVEDEEAWRGLGDEYHARLDKNYVTWVHTYIEQVERSFSDEELKRRPVTWTIGGKSVVEAFFDNVTTTTRAGIPLGMLPCRHFPQVTIPEVMAEHLRAAASKHL